MIIGLLTQPLWSPPPRAARFDTKRQKRTAAIAVPFVASSLFAVCFSKTVRATIVVMPTSAATPGDQLLKYADALWLWTYCSGLAFAFVGIYAGALANRAVTVAVWRLFALRSPAGAVPHWCWFVRQASSRCVYIALLVFVVGFLSAYFLPGTETGALVSDHATSAVGVTLLLIVLHRLRDRSNAIVGRDIWGDPTRARLATLIKIAILSIAIALVNELILRWR